MTVEHHTITWIDDRFVLYNHYLGIKYESRMANIIRITKDPGRILFSSIPFSLILVFIWGYRISFYVIRKDSKNFYLCLFSNITSCWTLQMHRSWFPLSQNHSAHILFLSTVVSLVGPSTDLLKFGNLPTYGRNSNLFHCTKDRSLIAF